MAKKVGLTQGEQKPDSQGRDTGEYGVPAPTCNGLCIHCTFRANGIHQNIQKTHIRYDLHPPKSEDRSSRHAHHSSLARHGLGDRMEEHTGRPCTRDNKDDMVQGTTNERLHTIRMATIDRCRNCDKIDTLQHLTECGDGTIVW